MKKRQVIINNKLETTNISHPDESIRNKSWIANKFIENFAYGKIINQKDNIFEISLDSDEKTFFFYFDTTDSGGRSDSRKVGIPFASSAFKKHICNNNQIYVINIYRPLGVNLDPINDETLWLIIDPKEIYSSKSYSKKTFNDSSRWFRTKILFDFLKSNNKYKWNAEKPTKKSKRNVIATNNKYLPLLFDGTWLLDEYDAMINIVANNIINSPSKTQLNLNDISKLRTYFRKKLISLGGNNLTSSKISNSSMLIASHIKSVETIIYDNLSVEQKLFQISDPNNGILIPASLDSLFDKKKITFDDNWKIMISSEVSWDEIKEACPNSDLSKTLIEGKTIESLEYLSIHREQAFKKYIYDN